MLPRSGTLTLDASAAWLSKFGGSLAILAATLAGILNWVTDHRPGLANGMPVFTFFTEHSAALVLAGAGFAALLVGRSKLRQTH